MPTIPIVPETIAGVPFAITPSNVTEAKLIAAYAEWDGTGASGNFLPCLAIYSDAGVRLGRVFPSSPVAAGDSAVVTYAPFPGGIGQKSTPGGSGIFWPAADQANAVYDKTTYPNNWSGVGNYDALVFANNNGVAAAIALQGDAFPRYVILADPVGVRGGGILMGDGTVDPASFAGVWYGAYPGLAPGDFAMQVGSSGQALLGAGLDTNSTFNLLSIVGGLQLDQVQGFTGSAIAQYCGVGVPVIGGNVADKYWRNDPAGAGTYLYNCTVAGVAGAAVWVGVL